MSEELSPDERRFGPRHEVNIKIFAHDGGELRRCTLRDIGLQGAFIETQDFPLGAGAKTELVIRLHREGRHAHYRFPARVVRTTSTGAALRFDELDTHLQQALVDLIYLTDSDQSGKASY